MCGCQIKQQIQQDVVLLLKCLGEYSIYSLPLLLALIKISFIGHKKKSKASMNM